jgi:hypothetical protein
MNHAPPPAGQRWQKKPNFWRFILSAGFNRAGSPRPGLKPEGQVNLKELILVDGIHLRNILVAAAGAQLVVDAAGITIPESSDKIAREAIGDGGVNTLQIFGAFKIVRVNQVGIQ